MSHPQLARSRRRRRSAGRAATAARCESANREACEFARVRPNENACGPAAGVLQACLASSGREEMGPGSCHRRLHEPVGRLGIRKANGMPNKSKRTSSMQVVVQQAVSRIRAGAIGASGCKVFEQVLQRGTASLKPAGECSSLRGSYPAGSNTRLRAWVNKLPFRQRKAAACANLAGNDNSSIFVPIH